VRRKQAPTHKLLLLPGTVRTSELSDAQAALAAIAKEKKPLDVKSQDPDPNVRRGDAEPEVASSIALLDTARH
jgi:hypothetical protein